MNTIVKAIAAASIGLTMASAGFAGEMTVSTQSETSGAGAQGALVGSSATIAAAAGLLTLALIANNDGGTTTTTTTTIAE